MSTSAEKVPQNEFTPEKLAETIFSQTPRKKNSCQLLLDQADHEYIFELLLKTVASGINVLYGDKAEISQITSDIKVLLNEYIESIGFTLTIETTDKPDDLHKLFFTDLSNEIHYCQVKLNDYPDHFISYTKKHSGHDKYEDKYKFMLNGHNNKIKRSSLADYYCIYFNKEQTKKFKISFDHIV